MPAKNLYLAINWKKIEYNVSFNSDGGSAVTGQRVEFEENATKPDDPTKTGYQFSGWTLS
jgi:hypothetical protein